MLKGVHHQIIEIRQTDDPYFERALLFVRADCCESSDETVKSEGRRFLDGVQPYSGLRRARVLSGLRCAMCAIGGGISGVLLGMFFVK